VKGGAHRALPVMGPREACRHGRNGIVRWEDPDMPPRRRKHRESGKPGVIAVPPTTPVHDWGDLGDERSQRRFEAIAVELAERYREILPRRRFRVEANGTVVEVTILHPSRNAGSTQIGPGWVLLMLPMPRELRLRMFLEDAARHLQEFVRCAVKDWPEADAEPHVTVTDQQVRVWYGTDNESAAPVRWRPFDRMLFQP
jgi:hypothetical protein